MDKPGGSQLVKNVKMNSVYLTRREKCGWEGDDRKTGRTKEQSIRKGRERKGDKEGTREGGREPKVEEKMLYD